LDVTGHLDVRVDQLPEPLQEVQVIDDLHGNTCHVYVLSSILVRRSASPERTRARMPSHL
jgi:hypothetical protein